MAGEKQGNPRGVADSRSVPPPAPLPATATLQERMADAIGKRIAENVRAHEQQRGERR